MRGENEIGVRGGGDFRPHTRCGLASALSGRYLYAAGDLIVRPADFRVSSYQAAVWTADHVPGVRKLMGLAIGPWADRFDSEPSVLPPAPELPPELPLFTVASRSRSWKLQVGPRRLDVFWERITEQEDAPGNFATAAYETIVPYLALSNEMRVTRLGLVVKRYRPDEQPARTLAHYFCREELLARSLNRPQQFELHAHKVYRPAGSPEVNSWVRWRTATLKLREEAGPVITVEQDLNTLAERMADASFSRDEILALLTRMVAEADSILAQYLDLGSAGVKR